MSNKAFQPNGSIPYPFNDSTPSAPPMAQTLADLNAEIYTLGSILIDPEAFHKVRDALRPEDFYRQKHGWIYEAMCALRARHEPIDFITLEAELEAQGKLTEIGGPSAITDLITETPTSLYIEYYAKLVMDMASRRRLIAACNETVRQIYDLSIPIEVTLSAAEQRTLAVSATRSARSVHHISDFLKSWLEDAFAAANNERSGVPTGFAMLDKILNGLQRSDLIVLAGRPGMGKTGMAMSIAQNAAVKFAARVLVFSVEMSGKQLAGRFVSMATSIDSARLRTGDFAKDDQDIALVMAACNELSNTSIFIDDTPAIRLNDVMSKARRTYSEHGLDLIIVDYMQIMTTDESSKNREQEVASITRGLKQLARELDVPVIGLAQLSRSVESRADKRPMLSDLRESGSIEQDSDVVLFVYREDYYIPDTDRQNVADILVAKHRNGATGTVSLFFRKELTQFRDLEINRTELDYDPPTYGDTE